MAILRSATGMVQLVVASKVGSFCFLFLIFLMMVVNLDLSPPCATYIHTHLHVYWGHLNSRDSTGQAHEGGLYLKYLVDGKAVIGLRKGEEW